MPNIVYDSLQKHCLSLYRNTDLTINIEEYYWYIIFKYIVYFLFLLVNSTYNLHVYLFLLQQKPKLSHKYRNFLDNIKWKLCPFNDYFYFYISEA